MDMSFNDDAFSPCKGSITFVGERRSISFNKLMN